MTMMHAWMLGVFLKQKMGVQTSALAVAAYLRNKSNRTLLAVETLKILPLSKFVPFFLFASYMRHGASRRLRKMGG